MATGRIWFADSPWPHGHALETLVWDGRLEPDSGLWFDLHLRSMKYAEKPPAWEDDAADGSAWRSPSVWRNYHRCTLSSTKWHRGGFLAGAPRAPLDLARLAETTFVVDGLPPPPGWDLEDDARFHIYLLGHDSAADHRIRFVPEAAGVSFALAWHGRIALTYAGDSEFLHGFRVEAAGSSFGGVRVPDALDAEAARRLLETCLIGARDFVLETREGVRRFVPAPAQPG
jgi:hypothetical protein